MSETPKIPLVDVAVNLITRGESILAVYNPEWGSFTLPMTKRRYWHDPKYPDKGTDENWIDAAAQAGAEWLGRTCEPELLLAECGEYHRSDRDGTYRRYTFRCFGVPVDGTPPLVAGAITEWLTSNEFQDRRPISPTAKHLVAKLVLERKLK